MCKYIFSKYFIYNRIYAVGFQFSLLFCNNDTRICIAFTICHICKFIYIYISQEYWSEFESTFRCCCIMGGKTFHFTLVLYFIMAFGLKIFSNILYIHIWKMCALHHRWEEEKRVVGKFNGLSVVYWVHICNVWWQTKYNFLSFHKEFICTKYFPDDRLQMCENCENFSICLNYTRNKNTV